MTGSALMCCECGEISIAIDSGIGTQLSSLCLGTPRMTRSSRYVLAGETRVARKRALNAFTGGAECLTRCGAYSQQLVKGLAPFSVGPANRCPAYERLMANHPVASPKEDIAADSRAVWLSPWRRRQSMASLRSCRSRASLLTSNAGADQFRAKCRARLWCRSFRGQPLSFCTGVGPDFWLMNKGNRVSQMARERLGA